MVRCAVGLYQPRGADYHDVALDFRLVALACIRYPQAIHVDRVDRWRLERIHTGARASDSCGASRLFRRVSLCAEALLATDYVTSKLNMTFHQI